MKFLTVIIGALSFCVLWNISWSMSVQDLVARSVKEVKPRQCVVWTSIADGYVKKEHLNNYQLVLKNLSSTIPAKVIDINNGVSFTRSSNYLYNVNISAPMHYFFIAEDLKYFFSLPIAFFNILNSIMYLSTPKCLLVIYQWSDSFNPIETILKSARSFQYVDFVILQVNNNNKAPDVFRNNFSSGKIERYVNVSESFKLFPEMMKNLKGYRLRVGIDSAWPAAVKNLEGYPASLAPYSRLNNLYEYFSEFLNVTTKYVIVKRGINRVEIIKQHNLEMVLSIDVTTVILNLNNVYILGYDKVTAVVPLIHQKELILSINNFYKFLAVSGAIIGIFLFFKYSRYSMGGWSILNIFKLILGNSASVQLQNIQSKIVYILIALISMFYITDLVSDLTAMNFKHTEELLAETVDEIFQKNLSICTATSRSSLRELSKMSPNKITRKILNISEYCGKRNLKENEVMISFQLQSNIRVYENFLNGINNSTLVDMDLPVTTDGVTFRHNSAFRSKFADADTLFKEFGLEAKWASDLNVRRFEKENISTESDVESRVIPLVLIILIGSLIAFTAFIFENIWYHISTRN